MTVTLRSGLASVFDTAPGEMTTVLSLGMSR